MRKVPPDLRRSAPVVREAVGTLLQALVCQQIAHTPQQLANDVLAKKIVYNVDRSAADSLAPNHC